MPLGWSHGRSVGGSPPPPLSSDSLPRPQGGGGCQLCWVGWWVEMEVRVHGWVRQHPALPSRITRQFPDSATLCPVPRPVQPTPYAGKARSRLPSPRHGSGSTWGPRSGRGPRSGPAGGGALAPDRPSRGRGAVRAVLRSSPARRARSEPRRRTLGMPRCPPDAHGIRSCG